MRLVKYWIELDRMVRSVQRDPNRAHPYTDAALTPVTEDETETLEMFTHSEAARSEVVHAHKIAALTGGTKLKQAHSA